MKSKLTPEQSQRLIELGVDPSKASAFNDLRTEKIFSPGDKPIFTLTDILSLLPKEIYSEERDIFYRLNIEMGNFSSSVCYKHYGYPKTYGQKKSAPALIDALFEMLCWTLTKVKK